MSNLPRSVPVPRGIADELAQHIAGKSASDFVFTAPGGGLLLQNTPVHRRPWWVHRPRIGRR
jgi:hypothetical protein